MCKQQTLKTHFLAIDTVKLRVGKFVRLTDNKNTISSDNNGRQESSKSVSTLCEKETICCRFSNGTETKERQERVDANRSYGGALSSS